MLGAYALDMALKNSFHRPRPPVSFFATLCRTPSASPAGTALFSVCWFGTLALLIALRLRPAPPASRSGTGAGLLAFAIGCSESILGVHYPTDVLAALPPEWFGWARWPYS